ncbi:hypothetical protein NEOLEDRAFT_1197349, partial [Neolentinus lepideus HHB14362 ss-1]
MGTMHRDHANLRMRGHGIEAVVDILAQYLGALPDSVLLHKWLEDITTSTKLTYEIHGKQLPDIDEMNIDQAKEDHEDEAAKMNKSRTSIKLESHIPTDFTDPEWTNLPEEQDGRQVGAKLYPLLASVSKICVHSNGSGDKKYVHCVGSRVCHKKWSYPRNWTKI